VALAQDVADLALNQLVDSYDAVGHVLGPGARPVKARP